MYNKLTKILHSTITKVISVILIILFCFSLFFCYEKYKRNINKIRGYYLIYQGDKAFKKKELQKAIYFYEKGIKYHPWHYRAMYNLANIYVVYEDYYSALKNYERALSLRPDYDVARIDYAIILSAVYKTDEAIEQYKKVLEYQPKHKIKIPFLVDNQKSYHYNRGVAYYNMGLAYRTKSLLAGLNKKTRHEYLNKASESYHEATEILDSYNSNYNLALIHQLLKNSAQSAHYYCRAMEIKPMEFEAHFNYAVLMNDLKEYDAASEEFKKAGLLLDLKGDFEKTRYIYEVLGEVNKKISMNSDKKPPELKRYDELYIGKNKKQDTKEEEKIEQEFYKSFSTCEKGNGDKLKGKKK